MSEQRYYDLVDDMLVPGRWVIGDPHGGEDWINPGQFTRGEPVSVATPLTFDLAHQGLPIDFSTDTMGVPVVSRRAADVLASICGPQVQLIEVSVEGHPGPYFIANATRNADCVDEKRSRGVRRWTAEDGQPARIGEYQSFDQLRIDPHRTGGLDLFRVARFSVALIVSERLKRAMEDAKLIGPKFVPMT